MGSKEDAILDSPERFLRYLKESDFQNIAQGQTQAERIRRLKFRFEKAFPAKDPTKGEHFIFGTTKPKDYDIRQGSEYARALDAMYNCDYFQRNMQRYAQPIMKERIKKAEERARAAIPRPRAPRSVRAEGMPKKLLIQVGGYKSKRGKKVAPYTRMRANPWTAKQSKWLGNRVKERSNKTLTSAFNNYFNEARTTQSIALKKFRLGKK